jgi:hypothetical protein
MNELLPYEEQLAGKMAEISLPGEDKGWDAMRKMLEKDDDDDVIPPPVTRGCRGWGMGLVLLLFVAVAVVAYKTLQKKSSAGNDKPAVDVNRDSLMAIQHGDGDTAKFGAKGTAQLLPDPATKAGQNTQKNDTAFAITGKTIKTPGITSSVIKQASKGNRGLQKGEAGFIIKAPRIEKDNAQITTHNGVKAVAGKKDITIVQNRKEANRAGTQKPAVDTTSSNRGVTENTTAPSAKPNAASGLPKNGKDSLPKQPLTETKQPVIKRDSTKQNTVKKGEDDDDTENNNKVWFGAGLALQQLIPIDGQKAVPYNSFGRKGSLGDYIPSAYFRVYRKKAFLQVEFRYGAPQYTKDIEYSKKILTHDSASGITVSSVNHVKKTYYHQLPLSIHYNVLPNWSIGAGVVWNKFQNAVVEQQTERSDGGVITTDSLSTIVNVKKDTTNSFAKSYFQFMLETQYTWKRFSFGVRYSRGLQPYLTFTSPVTGQTQKERNASLQIFLRYELWRSKKK